MVETNTFDSLNFSSPFIPHENFYISPTPISSQDWQYRLNRGGHTAHTPANFCIARTERHALNMVHCITAGSGSVTVRGKQYPLCEGQFFVLPAHEAHAYSSDPDRPMGIVWAEFVGGDSDRLTKRVLDLAGPIHGGELYQKILSLTSLLLSTPHPLPAVESQIIYAILLELNAHCSRVRKHKNAKDCAMLEYIDAHLGENPSLSDIADRFGYHPNYLSTRFAQIVGMPFSQYTLHQRINRACYILATSEDSIESITQMLGFYDVSYFTRRFHIAMGVTPSRYRKENRTLLHPTAAL